MTSLSVKLRAEGCSQGHWLLAMLARPHQGQVACTCPQDNSSGMGRASARGRCVGGATKRVCDRESVRVAPAVFPWCIGQCFGSLAGVHRASISQALTGSKKTVFCWLHFHPANICCLIGRHLRTARYRVKEGKHQKNLGWQS